MTSAYEGLPIYRAATDMVVYFEVVVRGFQRYHKYSIGSELRSLSYAALVLISQANIKNDRQVKIRAALEKLQELKIKVQICSEIRAFRRPNNFAAATRKVIGVAKQCEGWLRGCQNPGGQVSPQEGASKKSLGAHATGSNGIRTQGAVPQGSAPDGHKRR